MKKAELEQAFKDSIAKLCKVPIPGVADVALDIIDRVQNDLSKADDNAEITLEMVVRSLSVTGAKVYFEKVSKDKEA